MSQYAREHPEDPPLHDAFAGQRVIRGPISEWMARTVAGASPVVPCKPPGHPSATSCVPAREPYHGQK